MMAEKNALTIKTQSENVNFFTGESTEFKSAEEAN